MFSYAHGEAAVLTLLSNFKLSCVSTSFLPIFILCPLSNQPLTRCSTYLKSLSKGSTHPSESF